MSKTIEYEIFGDDMQYIEMVLQPQETVIAEPGVMMYMEDNIRFDTRLGDGTQADDSLFGTLKSSAKRLIAGESVFTLHYRNNGTRPRRMAVSAPYPGKILPISLDDVGGKLICQRDSFLATTHGTTIDLAYVGQSGIFSPFILQKIKGNGTAFLHGGGTVTEKQLNGERLRLDASCIIAFENTLQYNVEMVKNLKSIFFGKTNLFLLTLEGTGRIWFQSLPFARLVSRLPSNSNGSNSSEPSISFDAGGTKVRAKFPKIRLKPDPFKPTPNRRRRR